MVYDDDEEDVLERELEGWMIGCGVERKIEPKKTRRSKFYKRRTKHA